MIYTHTSRAHIYYHENWININFWRRFPCKIPRLMGLQGKQPREMKNLIFRTSREQFHSVRAQDVIAKCTLRTLRLQAVRNGMQMRCIYRAGGSDRAKCQRPGDASRSHTGGRRVHAGKRLFNLPGVQLNLPAPGERASVCINLTPS